MLHILHILHILGHRSNIDIYCTILYTISARLGLQMHRLSFWRTRSQVRPVSQWLRRLHSLSLGASDSESQAQCLSEWWWSDSDLGHLHGVPGRAPVTAAAGIDGIVRSLTSLSLTSWVNWSLGQTLSSVGGTRKLGSLLSSTQIWHITPLLYSTLPMLSSSAIKERIDAI